MLGESLLRALLERIVQQEQALGPIRGVEKEWYRLHDLTAASALDLMAAWTREHVERIGAPGVVFGASGGVDSSLVAVILSRALPSDRILGYLLPCDSDPQDEVDARALLDRLSIPYRRIPLETTVGALLATLEVTDPPRMAVGNLASRLRGAVLYWDANTTGRLVIGTGDLDESYIGYGCKGAASDIYPTSGLHKHEVRALLYSALAPLDEPLARRLARRPASPGYWKGQDAEREIGMTYDVLARVVDLIAEHCEIRVVGQFPHEPERFVEALAAAGVTDEQFLLVHDLMQKNYHKTFGSPVLHRPRPEVDPIERLAAAVRTAGGRRILHLGCGSGALLRLLLQDSAIEKVVGVDTSQADLETAAELLAPIDEVRWSLWCGSLDQVGESVDTAVVAATPSGVDAELLFRRLAPTHVIGQQSDLLDRAEPFGYRPVEGSPWILARSD